jgi:hypothetical protein
MQPKIDGIRVIIYRGEPFTRLGEPLSESKGAAMLRAMFAGVGETLDGEWAPKEGKYYVFDVPDEPGDYDHRCSAAIVNRRDHLTPRGPEGRTVTFSSETAPCGAVRCFSTSWSLARRTRPDCGPSRSILAWPLRHRPLPDDAGCIPLRREFFAESSSKGPAQVGLGPPFGKGWLHRLRLSQQHLRLTQLAGAAAKDFTPRETRMRPRPARRAISRRS